MSTYAYIFRIPPATITYINRLTGQRSTFFQYPHQPMPSQEKLNTGHPEANNELSFYSPDHGLRFREAINSAIEESSKFCQVHTGWNLDEINLSGSLGKKVGRKRLAISAEQIVSLQKSANLTIKEIAAHFTTSERQIYRILNRAGKEK